MREPLPLFCATSAASPQAARGGRTPRPRPSRSGSRWRFDREDREPEHSSCSAACCRFAELLAIAPAPARTGEGWADDEPTRLGRLARRLWDGLLEPRAGERAMSTATPGLRDPPTFDVCGPLPRGVTVLEASAGTGKTYTIAALAARYVAEGMPLEQLLLVTFTRMATGELRERVRERLVSAEQGLRRALDGVLPERRPARRAARRRLGGRGRRPAASAWPGRWPSFDAATIATTHGFCQEVLGGLGIAGDLEPDVAFVEDLSDLVDEVVDDLYVRRFSPGAAPAFGRAAGRPRSPGRRSTTPARRSSPPDAGVPARCAAGWPSAPATSSRRASARCG